MYYSISQRLEKPLEDFTVEIDPPEDGGEINLHLNGVYLAFMPAEWATLVTAVAEAQHPEPPEPNVDNGPYVNRASERRHESHLEDLKDHPF